METKNAGFYSRVLASIQDSLIRLLILFGVFIFFTHNISELNVVDKIVGILTWLLLYMLVSAPLNALYYTYFTSKFGGTIGKLVFGLKVVDYETGKYLSIKMAFFRGLIGYLFSGNFLGLGFLRALKHPEKLAWHDELFNTKVIDEGKKLTGVLILLGTGIALGIIIYINLSNIILYVTSIPKPTNF